MYEKEDPIETTSPCEMIDRVETQLSAEDHIDPSAVVGDYYAQPSIEETRVGGVSYPQLCPRMPERKVVDLDVLICATGLNAAAAPQFPVVGLDGKTLQDRFEPYPEAYMSMAVDGFPNFFSMLGPNSGVGGGSLTAIIESTGNYIVKCVRKMQKENIGAMHVKAGRLQDWIAIVDQYFKRTVFLDDCKSWYRRDDRVIGLWPGSTLHAMEVLRSPRWEDYEYVSVGGDEERRNALSWMGNGWSELQPNGGDLAWYIELDCVDCPSAPLPEETKRWKTLSFTY